ncbi:MAG: phosphate ABC transporter substrate-binding protein PstS [Firmicutes bacterium]|nr:phosphate ABC transporter substrate-binding protein PstS [Alicyclobacillaceae bacterium]MCL6496204.1 phosphate ABC transporter substrate-binding protein PstS [Bacillota bacterium]
MVSQGKTRWLAVAAGALWLAGCGGGAPKGAAPSGTKAAAGAPVSLLETGSTLLYPLFQAWVPAYEAGHPGVRITPAGTGSGTGIAQALAGTVQIGASDAYMSDAQMRPDILNIPLAISAQVVAYNLPGLNNQHLNLSGPILAGIYTGRIRYWDDPALKAANPGLALPHQAIIPVRRNDSSGDSFLFTQYLTKSAPSAWTVGYATSPAWPAVPNEASATGNGGMVDFLHANPDSIAYVGISYLNQIEADHLGYAALQNPAGRYVLPTQGAIEAAAEAMVPQTPKDERISLIDAPGADAYPIINYEYAIVKADQPNAQTAAALKTFLDWAMSPKGGNRPAFLDRVHFLPLPPSVVRLSQAQVDAIHG